MQFMNTWRKMILRHKKISWLLVLAMLALILFPVHMHLHHDQEALSTLHEHKIDVHVNTNQIDQGHHDEATVIDTASDLLKNRLDDNLLVPFILLTFILVIVVGRQVTRYYRFNHIHFFEHINHITPPLRAPPSL